METAMKHLIPLLALLTACSGGQPEEPKIEEDEKTRMCRMASVTAAKHTPDDADVVGSDCTEYSNSIYYYVRSIVYKDRLYNISVQCVAYNRSRGCILVQPMTID